MPQTENGNEIPVFDTPNLKYIKSNIDSLSDQEKFNTISNTKIMDKVELKDLIKLSPFRIRIIRKEVE